MKPNFEEMSIPDLRAYVLKHRDDIEAIRALFYHPSLKWKTMPPMFTQEGVPIEENIQIAEEAIRQRVESNYKKQTATDQETVNLGKKDKTTITQTEIEQLRDQLRDSPEAIATLDIIQECDGHLEDAVKVMIIKKTGKEPDQSLNEWVKKCRHVICKEEFREDLAVGLIAGMIEPLATTAVIPLGIAVAVAIYVFKTGIRTFCEPSEFES